METYGIFGPGRLKTPQVLSRFAIKGRLTVKLTVSFFDWGPSCPTDRARSLFSASFFLFFLCFIFGEFSFRSCLIAQQPSESFSLWSSIDFFAAQSTFVGSNDCTCVFPVLPLHPLRKSRAGFDGSSSTTISSQRCRHTRSPSNDPCLAEVFMIIFNNTSVDDLHKFSNDFFRSTNTEWPKARAIG